MVTKELETNKTTVPNIVSTKILKTNKNVPAKLLCYLINLLLQLGSFPDILKIAEIIPSYKKREPLECENYLSISLLSNIDMKY